MERDLEGADVKTKPMAHQKIGRARLAKHPDVYALGCEQGTGKTWMLLADAERQYAAGAISGLLVIAPKGVHVNWVLREIPKHMSTEHVAEFWLSGASQKHKRRLERLLQTEDALAILAINVDAVNTPNGMKFAHRFLTHFRCMIVVDESQRIKNPKSKRTQRTILLGEQAVSRRISSGTIIANSPLDLFGQFEFLRPGLLGTTSYRAFTSEFADVLPAYHPLVQHILEEQAKKNKNKGGFRGTPQIIRQDEKGNKVYRNLDKLRKLIKPLTYRVLKSECLDLPEKIYQTHYFELTSPQRRTYERVAEEMRFIRDDGDIDLFTAMTLLMKLRQITSGFILVDGEATELKESGPRLAALKEIVEDAEGSIIVWASFREEIRQVVKALRSLGVVQYHGGTSTKDRTEAVDSFQSGEARIFIAHPAAGGLGLTLTAASVVIYYSSSFSLEERIQSEDRAHRIGTRHNVVYIDLVARETVDERIAAALQKKAIVAAEILNGL